MTASNHTHLWTMPEIKRLRELYATMTAAEVAEQMGRTEHAIAAQVKRMRITKRRRIDWHQVVAKHRPVVFAVRIGGPQ